MLPSGDLVDTLRLVGAGVVVVGAGLLLFAPRLYPRVDLVSPWRPGKALQRLDLAKDNYLGYATAAALPGNPWMGMLFSSPSKKKFQEFGKVS